MRERGRERERAYECRPRNAYRLSGGREGYPRKVEKEIEKRDN